MNNVLLIPTISNLSPQCLLPFNFHVVRGDILIDGYQLYAVEKWIVDRKRSLPVLSVYTGHPEHTIPVIALAPDSAEEWDKAIHYLRRDGARPKQTPHGVIMNTSLAGFRSDFTIVYIPNGDFGAVKDQLYTNINLLRMGCSGRSALTLEEPSDTTKDRFISMYHLPEYSVADGMPNPSTSSPYKPKLKSQRTGVSVLDVYNTLNPQHATTSPQLLPSSPSRSTSLPGMVKTKDKPVFNKTVLELVKLIQAALVIFGMYDTRDDGPGRSAKTKQANKEGKLLIDGLLCDVTVEGIQRWTAEIGEPCVDVEPMERVADPSIVSALLSLVLATRNKLAALGYAHVPKDPFLNPTEFLIALGIYVLGSGSGSAVSPTSASTLTFNTPNYSQSHFASPHFPISLPPPRPGHHRSLSNLTLPSSMFSAPGTSTSTLLQSLTHADHNTIGMWPQSANASKKNLPMTALAIATAYLSRSIVQSITNAYDSKVGTGGGDGGGRAKRALSGDRGRVKRALKSTLEDLGNAVGVGDKNRDKELDGFSDRDLDARGAMSEGEGGAVFDRVEFRDKAERGFAPTQIFSGLGSSLGSGIGSLASGIGLGLGLPGSGGGGAATIVEPMSDLGAFVGMVAGSEEREGRMREREREKIKAKSKKQEKEKSEEERDRKNSHDSYGESVRSGLRKRVGRAKHRRVKDKDSAKDDGSIRGIGGTVRALWNGRVMEIVKLRELLDEMKCSQRQATDGAVRSDAANSKELIEEQRRKGDNEKGKWRERWTLGVASDGDVEGRQEDGAIRRGRSGDGHRSTEDESDNIHVPVRQRERPTSIGSGFSGWSGVRDKIGSWRQLTEHRAKRKKYDITQAGDAPTTSADANRQASLAPIVTGYLTPPRNGRTSHDQTESPTLYPFLYTGDDEDFLSSGQVSPVSDRLDSNPFHNFGTPDKVKNGASAQNSAPNLFSNPNAPSIIAPLIKQGGGIADNGGIMSDYDRKIQAFDAQTRKRPWGNRIVQNRVISWSDPLSARGIIDDGEPRKEEDSGTESDTEEDVIELSQGRTQHNEIGKLKRRKRGNSVGADDLAATGSADEEMDDFLGEVTKYRRLKREARRRRSYHDLHSFRGMHVLTPERMKIDVDLCGHYLVMSRREEHLLNVMKCLEIFSAQLSATNAALRSDYQSHLKFISELESSTKILASIESSRTQADITTQETNTLLYESDQFRLHDLWRMASMPRRKVLALREKVFGAGGRRRLAPGVHGAHGRFDRVQWTLDGGERLVDWLGRTESEEEEERVIEGDTVKHVREGEEGNEGEEDRDAVENPTIKPMWLLQFFTNWGARWGPAAPATASPVPAPAMTNTSSSGDGQDGEGKEMEPSANSSGTSVTSETSPISPSLSS